MMRVVSRTFRSLHVTWMTWASASALLFSALLVWPDVYDWVWSKYDALYPPVLVEHHIREIGEDEIIVGVKIFKQRDCDLVSRFGVAKLPDGTSERTKVERLDGRPMGSMAVGETLSTVWRIHPRHGSKQIIVRMRFECGPRTVIYEPITLTMS